MSVCLCREKTRVLRYEAHRRLSEYRRHMATRLAVLRRQLDQHVARAEEAVAGVVLRFRPAWQSYAYSAIRGVQNAQTMMAHRWEAFTEQATVRTHLSNGIGSIFRKILEVLKKVGEIRSIEVVVNARPQSRGGLMV